MRVLTSDGFRDPTNFEDLEIVQVRICRRGFIAPKHKDCAPALGAVRTMERPGFGMK